MKETVITIRTTNEDKERLEYEAKKNNMTLSQLMRNKIDNSSNSNSIMDISGQLCILMTSIQELLAENPDINLENINEEASKLWQLLK